MTVKTHVDRQVKERPILFNAEMVRAILDGRKTMTRRPIKRQPVAGIEVVNGKWFSLSEPAPLSNNYRIGKSIACPFGIPGDRIWVRENFQPLWKKDEPGDYNTGEGYKVSYPATDGVHEYMTTDDEWTDKVYPSIHMPRWASRITLEITGVRVERLQDISEEDAKAEGVPDEGYAVHYYCDSGDPDDPEDFGTHRCNWRFGFKMLWKSINGSESWQQNPWVWVIEFKRL